MSRKRRGQEKTGEIKGRIKSGNRKKRKQWKADEEEVMRKKMTVKEQEQGFGETASK